MNWARARTSLVWLTWRSPRYSQKDKKNNNNIGDILLNNTLFGTKRKKAAALQYVNKYLASTEDFPFNSADEIKFEQVNKTLIGKKIKVE